MKEKIPRKYELKSAWLHFKRGHKFYQSESNSNWFNTNQDETLTEMQISRWIMKNNPDLFEPVIDSPREVTMAEVVAKFGEDVVIKKD